MHGIRQAKQAIEKARTIVVSGHINPDGDCIGSLLSLGLGLRALGKRVCMVSWDPLPYRYLKLPGAQKVVKTTKKTFDLAIAVDCSNKEILGKTFEVFQRAGTILEIDHHEFRRSFGTFSYIDHRSAAVGEMIYKLLSELGGKITSDIAQNILTSLVVETGLFKLPNVTPSTFELCAKLLKTNINYHRLVDRVFWSRTRGSIMLSGICLARCKFLKRGRIVWSVVTKEDFQKVGGKDEDLDPVPDEMRTMKNVRIVVLFREKDDGQLRVSLRSKGKINVASVAEQFGGNGHSDIAGCYIPNTAQAMRSLLSSAEKLIA